MGRVKLEIKKLENSGGRQSTYSKRKHGILKKAQELSVLCDIDLILIMFSPGGKPAFCCGKHSIEEVIAKFNQLPPQERTKRKMEGLEALKKMYKKTDHVVDIQDLLGTSPPSVQDLTDQAARVQTRLAEIHDRLRYWTNPDRVNDVELLMQMEDSLRKSLEQVQRAKEVFQKRRQAYLESTTKLPLYVSSDQQLQQLLWAPSSDIQGSVITHEPKLPTPREIESCTGSTSGSFFGCLSASSKSEANSPGQLSGIENNSIGHDTSQGVQFGGQYSYLPYGLNMPTDNSFQAVMGMDQQQNPLAYDASRQYQPHVPWQDIGSHLLPQPPVDATFGDFLNYQKMPAVPPPPFPSVYERVARDPSLLFDNTLNHQYV